MADRPLLRVYQRALALSVFVFRATAGLSGAPGVAYYQSQLRRAVASIAANIAEGQGQETAAQFARCLSIAIASAHEAESHAAEMRALALLSVDVADHIQNELRITRAMAIALRTSLRARASTPRHSSRN